MAGFSGKTIRLTTAQAIVRYLQRRYSERDGQALCEYATELTYRQPHGDPVTQAPRGACERERESLQRLYY